MKRVQLSDHAQDDLNEIWLSVAVNNVAAADRTSERILALLQSIPTNAPVLLPFVSR